MVLDEIQSASRDLEWYRMRQIECIGTLFPFSLSGT